MKARIPEFTCAPKISYRGTLKHIFVSVTQPLGRFSASRQTVNIFSQLRVGVSCLLKPQLARPTSPYASGLTMMTRRDPRGRSPICED